MIMKYRTLLFAASFAVIAGFTACMGGNGASEDAAQQASLRSNPNSDLVIEVNDTAEHPNYVKVISDFRAIYHTETLINAPVEEVWAAATSAGDMAWSPSFRGFVGEPSMGAQVEAIFLIDGQEVNMPHKIDWVESQCFGWGGATDFGDHLYDNHMYMFVPVGEDRTLVIQSDDITNTAPDKIRLSDESTIALIRNVVEQGFKGFNEALKKRVEGRETLDEPELVMEVSSTAQNPNLVKIISDNRAFSHTEMLIEAPVETVWEVATGFDNMDWSPSFRGIEGPIENGAQVRVIYKDRNNTNGGNDLRVPKNLTWEEGKRFGWRGGGNGSSHVQDNHMFMFVPIEDNKTLFIQTDEITNSDPEKTALADENTQARVISVARDNFMLFNVALKEQAEARYAAR